MKPRGAATSATTMKQDPIPPAKAPQASAASPAPPPPARRFLGGVSAGRVTNRGTIGVRLFASASVLLILVLLLLTAVSGLLLLALREHAVMGVLLVAHLGIVLALFVTLPYGKLVHGLYRAAGLLKYRAPVEDRSDDRGDILARILAVSIGIDDDIGARRQRCLDTRAERRSEATVGAVADDVMHPPHARNLRRVVGAAVVDHQYLDRVDAVDPARQRGERRGKVFSLVQAGNLDDQLHRAPLREAPAGPDRPAAGLSHPP